MERGKRDSGNREMASRGRKGIIRAIELARKLPSPRGTDELWGADELLGNFVD